MTSLAQKLTDIVGQTFETCGLPREMGLVRVADRPDLAQFQCNGAMTAAKAAKKNPREVAQQVVENVKSNPAFSKIEIAGPGFINLNVTDEYLAAHMATVGGDVRLGVANTGNGATVIVDYGGPNVAKAMHVGHLRPTIIGDAVKRILVYAGYNALGDVHMGDWGLPIGQIISEYELRHPEWPWFDPDFKGEYPATPPFSYADLEKIYPEASQACKDDPARRELARKATAELQAGRRGYRALWSLFMPMSIADMKKNFDSLGVTFELWKGEADVADLIIEVEHDLKAKGLAVMSDGALVVPVVEENDNKEIPPLMYYKSDGAVGYATTDIVTIYDRARSYKGLAKLVYVVDKRQALHFEQVFRTARKAGYADGVPFVFTGFGTLNGPDNKPFKSRDGGIMKFSDMVEQAIEKARQRLAEAELAQDSSATEKEEIARKVAVAAIKFADLQNQAHEDYIFDLDRMSSFEGKTGPYLLYQAVRIKSLLRKAEYKPASGGLVIHDEDRPLILLLTQFPEAFAGALDHYAPHHLADYAHRLAQEFSRFYASCHILS
ncbi:MAG TPA: arginine--tRNA ligase, partial [Alphaproteobacteria bacterium]